MINKKIIIMLGVYSKEFFGENSFKDQSCQEWKRIY